MMEHWLPVLGFEGFYEVSDLGRVRGLDRFIGHPKGGQRLWKGRVLCQTVLGNNRYLGVWLCQEGVRTVRTVHSLVTEAFKGPRPAGLEVAHSNGKRTDNRARNLGWKTRSENHADKIIHGTVVRGEHVHSAKLTCKQVKQMRVWRLHGQTHEAIAARVGVTRQTAARAITGKHWAHV